MPETFSDADMDQFRSAWDTDGAIHSMGAWYRANAAFEMDVKDTRIAVPGLVILAPDDAFSPTDLARRSALFLENGRVEELDAGTHWVIQERPALIGGMLTVFFAGA